MERRELIPDGTSALAVEAAGHEQARAGPLERANQDAFSGAGEEASLAEYAGEPKRALYYFRHALETAPEDIEVESLADILESLNEAQQALAHDEKSLPALRAAVEEEPANSEKRFRYAAVLWRLGREEEAAWECETALEHPESLCAQCLRDCFNHLGWYLYRNGEYAKALPWFEQAARVKTFHGPGEAIEFPLAYENIISVYAALAMTEEAERAAREYIARFGRLPWPERRALSRIEIDADALYIAHCCQAA